MVVAAGLIDERRVTIQIVVGLLHQAIERGRVVVGACAFVVVDPTRVVEEEVVGHIGRIAGSIVFADTVLSVAGKYVVRNGGRSLFDIDSIGRVTDERVVNHDRCRGASPGNGHTAADIVNDDVIANGRRRTVQGNASSTGVSKEAVLRGRLIVLADEVALDDHSAATGYMDTSAAEPDGVVRDHIALDKWSGRRASDVDSTAAVTG